MTEQRQHFGRLGERLALDHLERLGYRLVARNHRTRWGEIDLVVRDRRNLVFVEVKTRRATARAGGPFAAIDDRKRSQVRRIAASWLAEATGRPYLPGVRFDAVGVTVDERGELVALDHLEAAF